MSKMNLIALVVGMAMIIISIISYLISRKKMKLKICETERMKNRRSAEITVEEFEAVLERAISRVQVTIWQAGFTALLGLCRSDERVFQKSNLYLWRLR